jgi:hypothetical protein
MTKQMFLIEYESSIWCGGDSSVVVWAEDEDSALNAADLHMEEDMRELFQTEYVELLEEYADEDPAYSVKQVEAFGPQHTEWKWFQDPSQSSLYPIIGTPI